MQELPEDLQAVVKAACLSANVMMLAEFSQKNSEALQTLVEQHQVEVKRLPQDVLDRFEEISEQLVVEQSQGSELAKRIYQSYIDFKAKSVEWKKISQSL